MRFNARPNTILAYWFTSEIALRGHLAVHHVARLIMVRMRQAVGLQVIVVALSVPRNDAINIMY